MRGIGGANGDPTLMPWIRDHSGHVALGTAGLAGLGVGVAEGVIPVPAIVQGAPAYALEAGAVIGGDQVALPADVRSRYFRESLPDAPEPKLEATYTKAGRLKGLKVKVSDFSMSNEHIINAPAPQDGDESIVRTLRLTLRQRTSSGSYRDVENTDGSIIRVDEQAPGQPFTDIQTGRIYKRPGLSTTPDGLTTGRLTETFGSQAAVRACAGGVKRARVDLFASVEEARTRLADRKTYPSNTVPCNKIPPQRPKTHRARTR